MMRKKNLSHLTRGAWIEIMMTLADTGAKTSHLTRGAWIEMSVKSDSGSLPLPSHLTRGAWIEI